MTGEERLPPDRAVRVLRAKTGELEARVLGDFDRASTPVEQRLTELAADLALVATLLADHIERCCR